MTLNELRIEIKDRLGIPAADTTLSDAIVDRAINSALRHIAAQAAWPWLYVEENVVLLAGANSFTPPLTWVTTHHVTYDGHALTLRDPHTVREAAAHATSVPEAYAIQGNKILLSTTLANGITVSHGFTQTEPRLVSVSSSPLLPDAYSEWAVAEGGVRLAIRTNNTERLAVLREEAAVARKATIDNVRRTAGLPRIRRVRPSIWQDV